MISEDLIKYFVYTHTILVLGLNAYIYGLWNLLFFCDISLFITCITFLIPFRYRSISSSIATLLAFIPSIVWTIDFALLYFGINIFNMARYMYDPKYNILMRYLSTFHIWLWIVHLYLLKKYRYSTKAFLCWIEIFFGVYLILNIFTPKQPSNINAYEQPEYKYIFIVTNLFLHFILKYFFNFFLFYYH